MKNIKSLFLLVVVAMMSCTHQENDFAGYVDPLIGTAGHGHVYPGATLPFGMVQLSPDTRKDSWDGCSGYHYSDHTIMGFSHTHLSGTGVGDYGDIRFMPTVGKVQLNPGTEENPETGYRSRFSHSEEEIEPGFYEVELDDYDIEVELTCTARTGFHEYEFPETDSANVIIDLTDGVTSDKILELRIEVVSNTEIHGMRRTDGWADNQYVYFDAEFSKPFVEYGIALNGSPVKNPKKKVTGKDVKAWVRFTTGDDEDIMVKVGISAVSAEGALNNRNTEIPGWNFEKVRENARQTWNNELAKIIVNDPDEDRKKVFYTAFYHSMLAPNLYSDADGRYRGHDNKIHHADGFDMYTVFSLWDTFRAEHPLFTLIQQKRTNDFINSMLRQYEQGGLLPVWELAANETNCMIGYHAVPVIVDAYMKNIRDYDTHEALEACINSAMQDNAELNAYRTKGYIPSDVASESVSKTLEYAYDDWCIAAMAHAMGYNDHYLAFIKRAQYYKNIFDPQTGFMCAKINEGWFSPFDPAEVNFNYTEANAWQYSFFVPQDVSGLMQLLGGPEKLVQRLDELFSASSETSGRKQSDISGMIGQYAHGNEPSHHMAYLYDYARQPWKTQEKVRQIMDRLYTSAPDGLCGNEDCGQMSAWYVMSALGFYPVTPGSNIYAIGSPLFRSITLNLDNGKSFTIETSNHDDNKVYIRSATLNQKTFTNCYLNHQTIMNGGLLTFTMSDTPNYQWGSSDGEFPVSAVTDNLITPVPFVKTGKKTFFGTQTIELADVDTTTTIQFRFEDRAGENRFTDYTHPLRIDKSEKLEAFARKEGQDDSFMINPVFLRISKSRTIKIKYPYANQYNAGGDYALIDLQRGGNDFKTGNWQGYEKNDLVAVINLGKTETVNSLSTGFLQDINAWIFMPLWVDYYISTDGRHFTKLGRVSNTIAENDATAQTKDFSLRFKPVRTKYIRVVAKNRGNCPVWHIGAGNPAWIFADEILINED